MLAILVKYKLALIGAALLGAVGLGGVGMAAASGALPLTALTAVNLQHAAKGAAGARVRFTERVIHGSVILNDTGSWVAFTLDAGRVTAISASAITLKRADGSSVTLTVSASTLWGAKGGTPKDLAKLDGRAVAVLSRNGVAVHVGGRGMLRGYAHASLTFLTRGGKTRVIQLDRGTVRSVSSTQISLLRADGVTITMTLAPHVHYHQAGVKGPAQASAVTPGEHVTLVIHGGKVIAVRIAAQGATPAATATSAQ